MKTLYLGYTKGNPCYLAQEVSKDRWEVTDLYNGEFKAAHNWASVCAWAVRLGLLWL